MNENLQKESKFMKKKVITVVTWIEMIIDGLLTVLPASLPLGAYSMN